MQPHTATCTNRFSCLPPIPTGYEEQKQQIEEMVLLTLSYPEVGGSLKVAVPCWLVVLRGGCCLPR